jgi:hypothetical protein
MSVCLFFGKFQIKTIPDFPGEALSGRSVREQRGARHLTIHHAFIKQPGALRREGASGVLGLRREAYLGVTITVVSPPALPGSPCAPSAPDEPVAPVSPVAPV